FAAAAKTLGDAPAEPRAVDRHHGVRPERSDRRDRLAHPPQNDRRPRQDFGDTRHGNVAERGEAGEALFLHALSADSGNSEIIPRALTQCSNQSAADSITGGFASNNENKQRPGCSHDRRTPTMNRLARSAAPMTSWRSSTMVAPASTAMPSNPASAASSTVRRPIVG